MSRVVDMTGQKIGHWTILERDISRKGGNAYWLCQCDCGNQKIYSIRGADLRRNKSLSCGCTNRKRLEELGENLIGQQFGKLTVIKLGEKQGNNRHRHWICQCSCGNITKPIPSDKLKNGTTTSCGCQVSRGEFKIETILKELCLPYEKEKSFPNLLGENGHLRFDFYLPTLNAAIEYQGIQHYESRDQFGGEEQFQRQIYYDNIKRKFCKQEKIHLIEIPYKDFKNINKEYLIKILTF